VTVFIINHRRAWKPELRLEGFDVGCSTGLRPVTAFVISHRRAWKPGPRLEGFDVGCSKGLRPVTLFNLTTAGHGSPSYVWKDLISAVARGFDP